MLLYTHMPVDHSRIDLILQYALLVAGEEDEYSERQLGPIHLIKYVYLADLSYARRNGGLTYTGVNWKFFKFGPWSQVVNERIEPALLAIGADRRVFESDYGDNDEWVRWSLRNEDLLSDRERKMPPAISMHLKADVHKYGKDTPGLLGYVYRTAQMLSAAPDEYLDFSLAVDNANSEKTVPTQLRGDTLSEKKKKKLRAQMRAIQEEHNNRRNKKKPLINPVANPRYDDVYSQGVAWLDELAGEKLTLGDKVAEFSDDVWKSSSRKGNRVS